MFSNSIRGSLSSFCMKQCQCRRLSKLAMALAQALPSEGRPRGAASAPGASASPLGGRSSWRWSHRPGVGLGGCRRRSRRGLDISPGSSPPSPSRSEGAPALHVSHPLQSIGRGGDGDLFGGHRSYEPRKRERIDPLRAGVEASPSCRSSGRPTRRAHVRHETP